MMPQTEQVSQFMDTLGSFYELVEEGVEASPVKELVKLPNGSAAADGSGRQTGCVCPSVSQVCSTAMPI